MLQLLLSLHVARVLGGPLGGSMCVLVWSCQDVAQTLTCDFAQSGLLSTVSDNLHNGICKKK